MKLPNIISGLTKDGNTIVKSKKLSKIAEATYTKLFFIKGQNF